jgi:protein O-mannosyl-transferase
MGVILMRRRILLFALAVLGGLLTYIYWPGLQGAFFFDDGASILLAEGVRLETLSIESLQQALTSGGAGPTGRPVAQLSFALNYYFSGFNPFAFKATNLAIHFACGVLVFFLTHQLLRTGQAKFTQSHGFIASCVTTAFWLLHPIQLLPVLHVVQRMTSLSAFFLLAAFCLHIHGRECAGRIGTVLLLLAWIIFWPLSCLSKEAGALFPLFALTWELIIRRYSYGRLDFFARVFAVAGGAAAVIALAYLLSPHAQWLLAGYDMRPFSMGERVLTEGRVLWSYLRLILLPWPPAFGLYHDDIAISSDLFTPWTTLPALCGLVGLIWLFLRLRTRAPLVAFGVAWFLIGHALESSLLPLEIAHEHRNYLPLFGISLIAGWSILQVLDSHEKFRTLTLVVTTTVLASITLLTALRSTQFSNELQRTLIEAQHHPASSRAQNEAGVALGSLPQAAIPNSEVYSLAHTHFKNSLALDPNFKMGWLGLIHLGCKAGLPVAKSEISELMRRLRETPFAPGDQSVLYNVKEMAISGTPCLNRSDVDGLFAAAVANPGIKSWVQSILLSWHADYLLLHEHDISGARNSLGRSLALNPANLSNRLKWAQLLLLSGERNQAQQLLLELSEKNFSSEERQTINELLARFKIK